MSSVRLDAPRANTSAPGWWLAEEAERAREYAADDVYYAEIDAQDAIDRAAGPLEPSLDECACCGQPGLNGLCGKCARGYENAGRF